MIRFIGKMLKLLTAVCFGTVAISQAMNIPRNIYSPVVPQEVDPAFMYQPNAFFGTKNNPGNIYSPVVAQGVDPASLYQPFFGTKNDRQYLPVLPQEKDWSSVYPVNPLFGTRNIGKVPIMHRSPIPQMDATNAVPPNPPIYLNTKTRNPQNAPNQQQQSHCENSEILYKIWSIFLNLLDTGGEVKNPDIEKVKFALKLIKEFVETAPINAQNNEVADKLLTLEETVLKDKKFARESKRSFRTFDDNIDINDTVLTSSHRLPEKLKDTNCIDELAKIIQTAQTSYIELTQNPVCKDSLHSPESLMRRSDSPLTKISPNLTISHKQYDRANFNNMNNLNAKNNEALKSSLGLLMNQSDYNAHDVFELLQNFKPIQPTTSVDAVETVVNDLKLSDLNQTELNPKLASDNNGSQTSYNYNYSQLSDNFASNDWTKYIKAIKIDPLNPNEIELTYALKRPQPLVYQPYYFIKYRLPFNYFLQNLGKVTQQKSTDTSKSELYKSVIQSWKADELSPDLAHYTKEQINELVIKEGNLVEALLIQSKDKNMRINLNTPENLESQLIDYNVAKYNTENGEGKHLVEAQAPYYSSDHDESRRRKFESNIRPGLDTPPRLESYPSMFQKGTPPTPLKGYSDHLLYKSGFGKILPAPHLPSPLIET